MMEEVEAVVTAVRPFDLHGVLYRDVTIVIGDRAPELVRLGPEGVPDGLEVGETVLATKVANMVISLRRPER